MTPDTPKSPQRLLRLVILLVGIVFAAGWLMVGVRIVGHLGLPLDDPWIHLQFAKHLALGDGLSYRGETLVAGSTAPLWTALLSVPMALGLSGPAMSILLGIGFYLASGLTVLRLGGRLGLSDGLAATAACFHLATEWMVWSALSGMEIPLFVWLSLEAVDRHLVERAEPARMPLSMVLFAASVLARPEGLLLMALAVFDRIFLLESRSAGVRLVRPPVSRLLQGTLLALVVLVPVWIVHHVAGGSPLPTTFAVKTDGLQRFWPRLRDLFVIVEILFRPQPWLFLLSGAGVLVTIERLGTRQDRGLLLPGWLLALPFAFAMLAPGDRPVPVGNFGRYLFPLFPALVLMAFVGMERVVTSLSQSFAGRWARGLLLSFLGGVLALPVLLGGLQAASRYALNVRNVEDSDVRVATFLRDQLPAEAVLGVQDVGAIAYIAPQPIVDMAGITSPEILPYLKGDLVGDHPTGLLGLFTYLKQRQVDFLVLFPRSYGGLETLRSLEASLLPIYAHQVPRNITMAGDEVMVLATPWGRYGRSILASAQAGELRSAPAPSNGLVGRGPLISVDPEPSAAQNGAKQP